MTEYDFESKIDQERFDSAYDLIINELDHPATIHDKEKHDLLFRLLELFEYLRGEEYSANPLPVWFEED